MAARSRVGPVRTHCRRPRGVAGGALTPMVGPTPRFIPSGHISSKAVDRARVHRLLMSDRIASVSSVHNRTEGAEVSGLDYAFIVDYARAKSGAPDALSSGHDTLLVRIPPGQPPDPRDASHSPRQARRPDHAEDRDRCRCRRCLRFSYPLRPAAVTPWSSPWMVNA